jgi:mono/diheme cytochrome c family protein
MKVSVLLFFSALMLVAFSSQRVTAAETDQGQKLFMQYCSSCHGKDAKGKGPLAPHLKIKIPDLSLLKQKNKGAYPLDYVMSTIDGRRAVRGHGDRECRFGARAFVRSLKRQNTRN